MDFSALKSEPVPFDMGNLRPYLEKIDELLKEPGEAYLKIHEHVHIRQRISNLIDEGHTNATSHSWSTSINAGNGEPHTIGYILCVSRGTRLL